MTNWTPSEDHIFRLQQTVNHLTNRRATLMEASYPLSFEQVVKITTPPRLQEFIALGYDSLQTTSHISYELGPEHGMGRRSVTFVQLPRQIQYAFSRQLRSNYVETSPIYFNRDGIGDADMEKLKDWTNTAVYERRLAMLVNTTVGNFFSHMGVVKPSMYHIMARWPGLKVVFPRATNGNYRGGDMWERHSNGVPRRLQRWAWPEWGPQAEWRATNQRRMDLAEEILLSCVSLADAKKEERHSYSIPRQLTAKLADWQVLGGAPF